MEGGEEDRDGIQTQIFYLSNLLGGDPEVSPHRLQEPLKGNSLKLRTNYQSENKNFRNHTAESIQFKLHMKSLFPTAKAKGNSVFLLLFFSHICVFLSVALAYHMNQWAKFSEPSRKNNH